MICSKQDIDTPRVRKVAMGKNKNVSTANTFANESDVVAKGLCRYAPFAFTTLAPSLETCSHCGYDVHSCPFLKRADAKVMVDQ